MTARDDGVEYDVIVLGAGAAGEAAATLGGSMGAKVAIVERDLVGGECATGVPTPGPDDQP